MRGRTTVGATAISVLDAYAHRVSAVGGRLYLSGVEERIAETIRRSRDLPADGPLQIMAATSVIGESTDAARDAAAEWIAERTAD
jgi:SulP family sulfate permease